MPRHSPYALIRLNFLLNSYSAVLLNCLSFIEQFVLVFFFAVKRFDPFYVFFFPSGWDLSISTLEIVVVYPNFLERPILISCLLKCVLFYLFVSTHFTSLFGFQWTFSLPNLSIRWWAQVDSNHRPRAYQARALTTWAMSPFSFSMYLVSLAFSFLPYFTSFADQVLAVRPSGLVEMMGFEPMTPCLQGRCSPNWATPPYWGFHGHWKLNN